LGGGELGKRVIFSLDVATGLVLEKKEAGKSLG